MRYVYDGDRAIYTQVLQAILTITHFDVYLNELYALISILASLGNVYVQDANLFANSTVNPDNKCFENEEIPSGLSRNILTQYYHRQ